MIVDYIDAHKEKLGVEPICRVCTAHGVAIAPSTARQATRPDLADDCGANAVHTVYVANRSVYGVRKLRRAMKRTGHEMGREWPA